MFWRMASYEQGTNRREMTFYIQQTIKGILIRRRERNPYKDQLTVESLQF